MHARMHTYTHTLIHTRTLMNTHDFQLQHANELFFNHHVGPARKIWEVRPAVRRGNVRGQRRWNVVRSRWMAWFGHVAWLDYVWSWRLWRGLLEVSCVCVYVCMCVYVCVYVCTHVAQKRKCFPAI